MQKILKNERGSVALFVLLSALFFLVVVTGVAVSFKNKEAQIDSQFEKIKLSYEKDANQVYKETVADASKLIEQPDGTFKDVNDNEWVWIEVPKTVTASATTDDDIYDALRTYVSDVIPTGSSSDGNQGIESTYGYTDTWYNGCGLSNSEYTTTKRKMLNSIKKNGGFYIGKYETGIDDSSIAENATTTTGLRTSSGEITQTAVIKQNKQPYTYVTCGQAETIAKGLAIGDKTASLLFGIQWDLVLKYIKVKERLPDNRILINNSVDWGNYKNKTYNITNLNAWYSTDFGNNWTKGAYNKETSGSTLLTTGAHTDFSKQKIYDFAGNVWEWTLEKSSRASTPCSMRGGYCDYPGGYFPAAYRLDNYTHALGSIFGFRVALY